MLGGRSWKTKRQCDSAAGPPLAFLWHQWEHGTWAQEMKALVDSEWPELVWSSGGMQTHAQSSPTGNEQDGEGGRPRHCAQPRRNAMLEGTQAMLLI